MGQGGEVLGFIGGAVLAIVPSAGGVEAAAEACVRAVAAARDAEGRMAGLNADRAGDGLDPLGFGIGLHMGDVVYGNIGVPERVEFSVIGPAANEAARIESMTKTLERPILISGEVAGHLDARLEWLGAHRLKGVGDPIDLFSHQPAPAKP